MSFSSEVKKEIMNMPRPGKNCCVVAACYGVACFGKYFDKRGIILHTEQVAVARYAQRIFEFVGISGKIFVKGTQSKPLYEFAVKEPIEVEKSLILFGSTGEEPFLRINPINFDCDACRRAFAASAFLCCGTVIDPQKDYNLEFTLNRHHLANDFTKLLAEHDIYLKHTVRKGNQVLYLKASEQIEDMLTFIGASNAALQLINYKIYRDFRNQANRRTNCETANIMKTVSANQQYLEDIFYLEERGVLELLPEPLKEAAQKRIENPEITLKALGELLEPPVSKSGVCHRMKKIQSIAVKERENAKKGME